jgi:hypothetical protein
MPAVDGLLYDISRDGTELLFMLPDSSADHASVLSKPLPAGPARLIVNDGWYPIWASDGRGIFFVRNDYKELDRANADGTDIQRIATSNVIVAPHLSPGGSRIRFTIEGGELREVGTDGSNLHPILAGQKDAFGGAWSPDLRMNTICARDERLSI